MGVALACGWRVYQLFHQSSFAAPLSEQKLASTLTMCGPVVNFRERYHCRCVSWSHEYIDRRFIQELETNGCVALLDASIKSS